MCTRVFWLCNKVNLCLAFTGRGRTLSFSALCACRRGPAPLPTTQQSFTHRSCSAFIGLDAFKKRNAAQSKGAPQTANRRGLRCSKRERLRHVQGHPLYHLPLASAYLAPGAQLPFCRTSAAQSTGATPSFAYRLLPRRPALYPDIFSYTFPRSATTSALERTREMPRARRKHLCCK